MNGFSLFSDPGFTSLIESGDWAGLFSAFHGEKNLLVQFGTISSTATDSSNTPTTTLRAGLILGIKTSDGKYYKYDPTATDGTQIPRAVLPFQLSMVGPQGVVADKSAPLLVRANLKVAELANSDAAALKALIQLGCNLDAPAGAQGLAGPIGTKEVAVDTTVTASDNGVLFVATAAATFTLPTKAVGLSFEFLQTADANMVIASAGSADDIIVDGDAGADSITYSTASHKIGSRNRMTCIYVGGSLKWVTQNLGGTTMTIA